MEVATVIPAYSPRPDLLGEALKSIAAQTIRPGEVVIVDDGSPTPVEVPDVGVPVRVIRQNNQGVSGARNRGIAATSAAVVHVLDQDDRVEPTFYERLLPAFADPALAVSFSRLQFMAEDGTPIPYLMPLPGWSPAADWFTELLREDIVGSAAAVFRRSAWQQAGGYQPWRYVQDYRMWLDIAAAGGRFQFHPEVLAWHRRHAAQATSDGGEWRKETVRMLARFPVPLRQQPRKWRTVTRHLRAG